MRTLSFGAGEVPVSARRCVPQVWPKVEQPSSTAARAASTQATLYLRRPSNSGKRSVAPAHISSAIDGEMGNEEDNGGAIMLGR